MKKLTKIVATIGPATESEEMLEKLILAGMNVARFNTKHGTPEWHQERIERVHRVATRMGVPVGVLLDLQGPEVRINIPGGQTFEVAQDQQLVFTGDEADTDPTIPHVPLMVVEAMSIGDRILIDDGAGEFEIVDKSENRLITRVLSPCPVSHRKTFNTPGVTLNMPSLIPQDLFQLDASSVDTIDFVGLSFVRNATDIKILRDELAKRNLHSSIVAKIENQSALDNLDQIIDASDAVMVARGDLAVEVDFQQLAYWQKEIILRSRIQGKPVITATQMLKSMVEKPRPTRAEVTDVANAIFDGTDAIMLSEETTIGKYPVEAVQTQASIALFNEPLAEPPKINTSSNSPSQFITHAAVSLFKKVNRESQDMKIDRIICLTETGMTAQLLSRFRAGVPIEVFTSSASTMRKLCLVGAVNPRLVHIEQNRLESSEELLQKIKGSGAGASGENILLVHGTFWKQPGLTNTLSVIKI